jgi:hypothetical protein
MRHLGPVDWIGCPKSTLVKTSKIRRTLGEFGAQENFCHLNPTHCSLYLPTGHTSFWSSSSKFWTIRRPESLAKYQKWARSKFWRCRLSLRERVHRVEVENGWELRQRKGRLGLPQRPSLRPILRWKQGWLRFINYFFWGGGRLFNSRFALIARNWIFLKRDSQRHNKCIKQCYQDHVVVVKMTYSTHCTLLYTYFIVKIFIIPLLTMTLC